MTADVWAISRYVHMFYWYKMGVCVCGGEGGGAYLKCRANAPHFPMPFAFTSIDLNWYSVCIQEWLLYLVGDYFLDC